MENQVKLKRTLII